VAIVEPFCALRYDDARVDLSRMLAPSLDLVDERKRSALLAREPRNVLAVSADQDALSPEENHTRHRLLLAEMRRAGIVRLDDKPALYVVRETVTVKTDEGETKRSRMGFFASVTANGGAPVLPHEHTLPPKHDEASTLKEPLLLLFDDVGGRVLRTLRAEVSERDPDARGSAFGETFELFVVDDETACARVQALLEERELLIADGHHRFQALGDKPFVAYLTVQDDPANRLGAIHRVIDVTGFRRDFFTDRASAFFTFDELGADADIESLIQQGADARAVLVDKRGFLQMTLKPDAQLHELSALLDDVGRRTVSTALLSTIVLDHLLSIDDPSTIRYVPSATTAIDLVARAEAGSRIALLLPPPPLQAILDVARAGARVPAKTTSFMPKMVGGLVVMPIR
jgi:uncharacterized protein (DUF1015 family)